MNLLDAFWAAAAEPTFGNIDNSIIVAFLAAVSTLGAAWIVQKYTARSARRAHETQQRAAELASEVEDRKMALAHAESWRQDTIILRQRIDEDQRKFDERMARMEEKIDTLQHQVGSLEDRRRDDEAYIDQLVKWCKVVVVLLRQHGIPHPQIPPGITDSNPRLAVVRVEPNPRVSS